MAVEPGLELAARQTDVPGNGNGAAIRPARFRKQLFFNRELSWLDFNARVLEEAVNPANPLLERLRFLAIFSNNLDEFFMIHVPGLRDRLDEETGRMLTERDIQLRISSIRSKLLPMLATQARCLRDMLPQLARYDIRVLRYSELSLEQKAEIALYFEREVFPVLTPLALGPGHPFPYISNLSLSLAMVVLDPTNGMERFARVKVPTRPVLPRLVPLSSSKTQFVLLEEVIIAHIGRLFPGMEIKECHPFRVTRNADLEIQEDAEDDLLEQIEEKLSRRRFGEIERLELASTMPESIRQTVIDELKLPGPDGTYLVDGPLNLADLMPLANLDFPDLRFPPFVASIPQPIRGASDIFAAIRHGDILVHHPFQTFDTITEFIRQASDDPQVLTIKHTLYRTSGDSPIIAALADAAANGTQVACLVELKARFDEANNINWARRLEDSGVHVVYGLPGLKTHCKVTLVVRREEDGLRRYVHIGTGNYNQQTAAVYTDIGLLTCRPDFGADATDLFNYLTGYSRQSEYRRFLVAPVTLRRQLQAMIEREIANQTPEHPGRIIAKMNSLVDPGLIRALYAASNAGVKIDMIVRGMCCLRPGEPGLSENIRVISVIGRFLEHSRIFYFQNGGNEELYFGSADWMPRNLDRRIEVVVPMPNPEMVKFIVGTILQTYIEDNCQVWDLQPEGAYERRRPSPGQRRKSAQTTLLNFYCR